MYQGNQDISDSLSRLNRNIRICTLFQVGKNIEKSSTFIALSAASASQSKAKFIQTPAISISFLII
jgi:hypothetical protein